MDRTCKSDSRKLERLCIRAEAITIKLHRFLLEKKGTMKEGTLLAWIYSFMTHISNMEIRYGFCYSKIPRQPSCASCYGHQQPFTFQELPNISEGKYKLQMIHDTVLKSLQLYRYMQKNNEISEHFPEIVDPQVLGNITITPDPILIYTLER